MRIQHNITAMNAYRNYTNNTAAIGKNLEKLSSGYKINRAGDDAAGLAVSQKMRLQIAGLEQAQKNAKSGISYVQTAEGALQEVHQMLERMYTLAEQSANGTFDSDTDRTQLQKEVNNLMEEINRIGKTANFNGQGIFSQYVGGTGSSGGAGGASGTGATDGAKITLTATGASADTAGSIKFTDSATAEQQKALNDAIAKGAVTLTYATTGTKLTLAGTGLTDYKISAATDADGSSLAIDGTGKVVTLADPTKASTLTLSDKDGNAIATIDVTKVKDGEALTITSKQTGESSTLDTSKAADDVSLAKFGIDSIDFSGVELEEGKDVTITYTGSGATGVYKVTIDGTDYTSVAGKADDGATLTANAANGDSISIKLVDNWTAVTPDTTANAKVGVVSTGKVSSGSSSTSGGAAGAGTVSFWIGAENIGNGVNKLSLDKMSLACDDMSIADPTVTVGVDLTGKVDKGDISGIDITDADSAMAALNSIKDASNAVSNMRGTLGAMQNRLDHTINNLSVMQENMQDAESVIRDTDIAQEMMAYTKNSILIQSAQAMLAQANQLPQGVLQLLQ